MIFWLQTKRLSGVGLAVLLLSSACGTRMSQGELAEAGRAAFRAELGGGPSAEQAAGAPGSSDATDTAATPEAEVGAAGDQGGSGRSGAPAAGPGSAVADGAGGGSSRVVSGGGAARPTGSTDTAAAARPGAATASGTAAGGDRPAAPVDVPGSAKSEIRLGVLGIQTGPIGNAVIPVVQGTKAWAADVNARGGLAGRPVRLIIADDGGDPNRALALVKRLVEENKVHSLFAVHMPTDLQAIVPYLEEKQVPAIGTCACDTTFGESPMVFGLGMSGLTALTWAHLLPITAQTDKRKAGVLYCREASICGGLAQQIDAVQAKSGVTVAFKAQMSLAQPDYTAEVLAARNAGADVIIVLADNATLIRVARSAHRQGYFPLFAGQHSSNEDRFLANGGEDVEGAVISAALAEYSSSPLLADYRAAMDRYVPGGIKGSLGALAWAAGKALEVIAPRLPANPTPADIIEGMYSLKGETLGGIVPPTTFERGKGHDATNQCVVPLRIVDRKFAIHNPANPFVCVPGWKPVGS